MARSKTLTTIGYDEALELVAKGLIKLIGGARGSCVSATPKRVLEAGGYSTNIPVELELAKYVLTKAAEKELVLIDDSRSRTRFVICRNSPLWSAAKSGDLGKVLELLSID